MVPHDPLAHSVPMIITDVQSGWIRGPLRASRLYWRDNPEQAQGPERPQPVHDQAPIPTAEGEPGDSPLFQQVPPLISSAFLTELFWFVSAQNWEKDPETDLVVIKGAGEKAFCAGGDIRGKISLGVYQDKLCWLISTGPI